MKALKRIVCLALAMSVVFGMTGCKKSKFSQQAVRKYAKAEDYDEYDDNKEFYHAVGSFNEEQCSYITATKRDARDLFNTIVYRFEVDRPKYDFTEVTALVASGDDGFCIIVAATFEDVEEAEKFFKKFPKTVDMENEDKGEEKSYSYFISYDDSSYTRTVAYGLYKSGNTVIWLRTASEDCEAAEDFCEHFNLISPLEA